MEISRQQRKDFINYVIDLGLLEEAIEWIASNMEPGDIFSTEDLRHWATENGFEEFK